MKDNKNKINNSLMKNNTKQTVRDILTFLFILCMTLPAMANSFSDKASRSGTSGGVKWNANFQIEFENNTGHSYSWWTGDGEGGMWNRLRRGVSEITGGLAGKPPRERR